MRKIAFCLISFLTLSLPCTMSWGGYYAELINGKQEYFDDTMIKMIQQILDDIYERGNTSRGNYIVAHVNLGENADRAGVNANTNSVILVSGGDNDWCKAIIVKNDNPWAVRCQILGLKEILKSYGFDNCPQLLDKLRDKKEAEISEEDLRGFLSALQKYTQDIGNYLDDAKICDERSRAETLVTDNIGCGACVNMLKYMSHQDKDRDDMLNFVKELYNYLGDASVGNGDDPDGFQEFCMDKYDRSVGAQAAKWLKRSLHTEVQLIWFIRNNVISLRNEVPLLSLRNPCESCIRCNMVRDWCKAGGKIGFLWLEKDGNKNIPCLKVKGTQTDYRTRGDRLKRNGTDNSQAGKIISCTDIE